MKTTAILASVLLLALAGCGGDRTDPLVGTYAIDVARTTAAGPALAGLGKPRESAAALVQQDLDAAGYRLDIRPDGTFLLRIGGSPPFEASGTWRSTVERVVFTTTTAGGEPASAEDGGDAPSSARMEGPYLVLETQTGDVYLRKT